MSCLRGDGGDEGGGLSGKKLLFLLLSLKLFLLLLLLLLELKDISFSLNVFNLLCNIDINSIWCFSCHCTCNIFFTMTISGNIEQELDFAYERYLRILDLIFV